jgi:hypothetical protein
VNAAIAAAVGATKLTIWYGGGPRLIEPHAYGLSKKGKELLKAYQVSGHSNSGHPTGWKTFRVDRITAILPADEDQQFTTRPDWTAPAELVTTFATL